MAYLDHLEGRELKQSYVNGVLGCSEGVMHTPWGLLDLLLTCIYWVLKSLDASSKQAKAAILRVCVVFGNLKEQFRDVESPWHLMGSRS